VLREFDSNGSRQESVGTTTMNVGTTTSPSLQDTHRRKDDCENDDIRTPSGSSWRVAKHLRKSKSNAQPTCTNFIAF